MRVTAVLFVSVAACQSGALSDRLETGDAATSDGTEAAAPDATTEPSSEVEGLSEASDGDVDVVVPEVDVVSASDPFDRSRIGLQIAIGDAGRAALTSAPTVPVAAALFVDGGTPIAIDVVLVPQGSAPPVLSPDSTLLVHLTDPSTARPSLPASFVLDPSTTDPSYLRAALATLFYRRIGTPVARTTFARVAIDGTDFGLFVARENGVDPEFLQHTFGPGGSLFAPTSRADFWTWQVSGFGLLTGQEADRSVLDLLVAHLDLYESSVRDGNLIPFADSISDVLDVDAFLDFMAAGIVVGHYGGYGAQQSDFGLYVYGRVTFMPLRLEHTYPVGGTPDPTWSSSRILRLCINEAACRARWSRALDAALDRAESPAFQSEASALRGVVQLELESDTRPAAPPSDVTANQEAVLAAIRARAGWLRANGVCLDPASVDHDGDGYSPCTDDCDDDDPTIHPGATDVCGNLRDDDCDLHVDNGPGCPPCTRVPAFDPRWDWEICPISRTWAAALADCRSRGGDLASIGTYAENETLVRSVLQFDWSDWWFGLSDRDDEGAFIWSDGRPLSFRDWDGGEPNDSGNGEDCGHIAGWAGGRWNDAPCDWWKFYVCERAREPVPGP